MAAAARTRTRLRRPALILGVCLIAASSLVPGGAFAADPQPPAGGLGRASANLLDQSISDLAHLPVAGAPDGPPLLVTVAPDPAGDARAIFASVLAREGERWVRGASVRLQTEQDDPGLPWLVEAGEGRFVLLSTDRATNETLLVGLRSLVAGVDEVSRRSIPERVTQAAVTDVDGDGRDELVVRTTRRDATCGTSLLVLDRTTLRQLDRIELEGARLHGAVVGELDGRPGADLAAYASGLCGAQGVRDPGGRIVAIRLADGSAIAPPFELAVGAAPSASGPPLLVDVGGDGIDEVLVTDIDRITLVEPAVGMRAVRISGDGRLLGAGTLGGVAHVAIGSSGPGSIGGSAAVVLRLDHSGVVGVEATPAGALSMGAAGQPRLEAALDGIRSAQAAGRPTTAWHGDLAGLGCPELVVPLVRYGCPGAEGDPIRSGPAWIATAPLTAFGAPDDRRLLVASSVAWTAGRGAPSLVTPTPAFGADTAWRSAPDGQFQLAEASATDLAYFRRYPSPVPTIDRRISAEAVTTIAAVSGVRLLVRATAADPDTEDPIGAPIATTILHGAAAQHEESQLVRLAVPSGESSGIELEFARVSLRDAIPEEGMVRPRWIVSVVALNDWGELSDPLRVSIVTDLSGPSLALDEPFLTAPWPFAAPIRGRTEPGVRISLDGGPFVEANRGGRFEFRGTLAPWPQTFELRAVDDSGNATIRRVTLIGGVDWRQLPWQVILAVVVLGAVAVGTLRAGRSRAAVALVPGAEGTLLAVAGGPAHGAIRRDVAWLDDGPDRDPLPEIEEIPNPPANPRPTH